jgi:tyrosine-protein phosphatase SIW14
MSFRNHGLISLLLLGLPALAAGPSVPGIDNFYEVDQHVYRGAQPTPEGFGYLSQLGVKVVLDLREHDGRSASEERLVTAAGMRYVNVPMSGLTPPTQAETDKILALLEDPAAGPVFVHCKRGADRTGAVIAAYRIDHEKWDNTNALKEARADGMRWMQFDRQKFIRTFQARAMTSPAAGSATLSDDRLTTP